MTKESYKQTRTFLTVLQEDWRSMLYDEDSKDFLLLVGSQKDRLRIHKAVLQARCSNLRGTKLEGNELALPTIDSEVMRNVKDYLYTAEIVICDIYQICPLLQICHKLGLSSSLQSYAIQCLDSFLTTDNVCKIITQAHEAIKSDKTEEHIVHTMWTVINICLEFAVGGHNTDDILSSDSFLELSQEVMIVVVSAKLKASTEEILKALLRWARHKVGTSKLLQSDWTEEERDHIREHIDKVIKHIHVADGQMSPDAISDGLYGMLERYSWTENSLKSSSVVGFPGSKILVDRIDLQAQLNVWYGNKRQLWNMLYQGSTHGFSAQEFHSHCDGHSPTIVIVQSTSGHIFGGYSDAAWTSQFKRGRYISSQTSFLFSLVNPFLNTPPAQFKIQQPSYAINSHPQSGPIFGSGADLCISNNCHFNQDSYSNFPTSYSKDQSIDQTILAGTKYFTVQDYEVFGMY